MKFMKANRFWWSIAFLGCPALGVFSQPNVVKISALKSNNYGVQYVLPKTQLVVDVEYHEVRRKAGPYAKYASAYLGRNNAAALLEDQSTFTLDKVSVSESGVPNKEKTYLVTFKAKTTAPYVYLTEEGLLCTINVDYMPEKQVVEKVEKPVSTGIEINPQSVFTEEYLRASSVSKMAEVAAKNIYKIRESRQDILTGDASEMPKDGEAIKLVLGNLEAQERVWMELFVGTYESIRHHKQLTVEPTKETNNGLLFRFSTFLGMVDTDDLSGRPITLTVKDLKSVKIPVPDPKKKVKEVDGITYNVPGKAEITIVDGTEQLCSTTVSIVQFGTTQVLAPTLFEDNKKPIQVHFYPQLGAIKQISQ
ncbi:DUF4831 domain-containing protein [Bacteroidia bacterium]|nr:DUF4831 domain-containing protein [Bacteroidia bacterium]